MLHLARLGDFVVAHVQLHQRVETRQAAKARHAVILQRELRQRQVRGQILQARIGSSRGRVCAAERVCNPSMVTRRLSSRLSSSSWTHASRPSTREISFCASARHPRQTIEVGQTTTRATLQQSPHGFPPRPWSSSTTTSVVDSSSPVVLDARLANRSDQLADAAARLGAYISRVCERAPPERRAALRRLLAIARGHRHAVQGLEPRQST